MPCQFFWLNPHQNSCEPSDLKDPAHKQQSREIKKLYQAYMPWAKPKGREKLAIAVTDVIRQEVATTKDDGVAKVDAKGLLNDSPADRVSSLTQNLRPIQNKNHNECQDKPQSSSQNHSHTSFAPQEKQIIAAVRLRPIGEFELLTGMLVHPDFRGQGVGEALLKFVTPGLNIGKTFLYALPHLQDYYSRAGFKLMTIDTVPNDIGQLYLKYSSQKPLVLMGL